jgi:hypothetical protein
MKSTPLSQGITMLILVVFMFYGFFALPFAGFMMSLAIGLISYGATESFELSTAAVLASGVIYSLIARSSYTYREGFSNDGATQISERVRRIYKANVEPHGVYASAFVEGFADAAADPTMPSGTTDQPPKPASEQMETADSSSKPASATSGGGAGSGLPVATAPPVASKVKEAEKEGGQVSGFTGSSDTSGQFKLGELPKDSRGGFHIDQGTTVINALNALKPDQVKAMTQDTQALIETQKSLMGMLSSMKPMLQDGKQMMDTFQQMFGTGAAGGQFGQLKL